MSIYSIHDVLDSAGSNYLLALSDTKLKSSLNGTVAWTTVKSGLTSGLKLRTVPYLDKHIFTNGSDQPFTIGGTGFANVFNLDIAAPDMQGASILATIGGNLEDTKFYSYLLVYVTDKGEYSDAGHPLFGVTTSGNKAFDLAGLPVSSDTRVTGRKLYRTQGWGTTYYLLASLDNVVTTYDDLTADTDLDTSQSITLMNTPSKSKYLTAHRERIIHGYITRQKKNIIQKPYASLSYITPSESGGSLSAGTYKYKYSYLHVDGSESILSPYFSAVIAGATGKVTIGIFYPFEGADRLKKNRDISGYRFYRTTAGGSTYYYAGQAGFDDGGAFVDTVSNATLVTQGTYPKNGQTTETTYKSRIVYSEIGKPSEYPEINEAQVFEDDGDSITGIFDDQDGVLIFKEKSICKIYTLGSPQNWQVRKIIENIGATEDAICKNGNEYFFISGNRPYLYSNGSYRMILDDFPISFDSVTAFNGVTYSDLFEWYILSVSVSATNYLFCYNTKLKTWYTFSITSAKDLLIKKYGSTKGTILIAGEDYVLKYDPTSEVDNEAGSDAEIVPVMRTKTFNFPDGITLGRLRYIYLNYLKRASQGISVVIQNPDDSLFATIALSDSSGSLTSKLDTDTMTGSLETFNKFYLQLSAAGLKRFNSARVEYRSIRRGKAVSA